MSDKFFWIIQKSVNSSVTKCRRVFIQEEVAVKPAEISKFLKNGYGCPYVEGYQQYTKRVSEKDSAVSPVKRKWIEFVRCYQEGNVGHAERKIVDTVEEIVEDRKENEEIQKISKNNFESTPFSARQLRYAISNLPLPIVERFLNSSSKFYVMFRPKLLLALQIQYGS